MGQRVVPAVSVEGMPPCRASCGTTGLEKLGPATVAGIRGCRRRSQLPSFGAVHRRVEGRDGKVRRCHSELGCGRW